MPATAENAGKREGEKSINNNPITFCSTFGMEHCAIKYNAVLAE
jgi:hypothetical protein